MLSELQPGEQLLLLLLIIAAVFVFGMAVGSKWEESDSNKLRRKLSEWQDTK